MKNNPIKLIGLLILLALVLWLGFATTGHPSVLKPERDAPPAVLFDNVRIISMVRGAPETEVEQAVLVVGDTVSEVGPAGSIHPPLDAVEINATGMTLIPGLIDAHVHLWDEAELAGYLAYGVTGIRNLSGMPFHLPLARRIQNNTLLGPDLVSTGPILNSAGANQQGNHQLVETTDEASRAVQATYAAGYRLVKVYSNIHREL